jgi:histidinol-phosphate aminotransferase
MANAVSDRTKLVFIANPNNPTGTIVGKEALTRFLDRMPDHVTVVLDEAYFEFAHHDPDYPDGAQYLREGRNVIALRTFSKVYGLAGLRVGYGFVSESVADAVNRARLTFNVSNLAQVAAYAALDDEDHVRMTLENNAEGQGILAEALLKVGAYPIPSYGNFVFADMGQPGRPIFDALLRKGVIIRPGDIFGMPNYIRVSIGTVEECTIFAHALRSIIASD